MNFYISFWNYPFQIINYPKRVNHTCLEALCCRDLPRQPGENHQIKSHKSEHATTFDVDDGFQIKDLMMSHPLSEKQNRASRFLKSTFVINGYRTSITAPKFNVYVILSNCMKIFICIYGLEWKNGTIAQFLGSLNFLLPS